MISPRRPVISPHQRRVWPILLLVGLAAVLITLLVAKHQLASDEELLRQHFIAEAEARASSVATRLRSPLQTLDVLRRLCGGGDAQGFARCVKAAGLPAGTQAVVLARQDGARLIVRQEVAGPESARASGSKSSALNAVAAIAEAPPLRNATARALKTGTAVALHVTLPGAAATDAALLIVAPASEHSGAPASAPRELILMTLDTATLFAAANDSMRPRGLDLELLAEPPDAPPIRLAHWLSRLLGAAPEAGDNDLDFTSVVDFAGLPLHIHVRPTQAWLDATPRATARAPLIAGVMFTLLVLFLLHQALTRRAYAETLVAERTAALAERQHAYAALVEQLPDVVLRIDQAGRLRLVNGAFEQSFGLLRQDVLGHGLRHTFEHYPGLDPAVTGLWQGALAGVFASQQERALEFGFPTLNGPRFFDGMLIYEETPEAPDETPLIGGTGSARRPTVIGIFREVTERRAAESWARKLSLAVEQNPATIVITDPQGRIEYVNDRFCETTGYARADAIGQNPRLLKSGETPATVYRELWQTILAGQSWRGEFINRRRDGSIYHERAQIAPICDSTGRISHFVAIKEDISEMKAMIDRLHDSEARFRSVVGAMAEGLTVLSADGSVIFANAAAADILGQPQAALLGRALFEGNWQMLREDGAVFAIEEFPALVALREQREVRAITVGMKSPNGRLRWLLFNAAPLSNASRPAAIATFSDITESKEAHQRVEFLAHHDPLTRLPNRLLLRDRVDQARALASRMNSRFALLFLDLDRFKTINDSLGHPVGDALLVATVARLRKCLRESDTLARLGGDEFVVVINDVRDTECVARIADKIHEQSNEPLLVDGHTLSACFSIGIAFYPDDAKDFDALMQKADTAMYHAKQSGRNTYRFFAEQMNVQAIERLDLETRLRRALENSEFVLHYQPQIDLAERRIIGAEALIRWADASGNLTPPSAFIPVAEECGLIVPIGAWVLREACRQASEWQRAGLPPFVVAVNLSAAQFRRHDLVETVIEALVLADLDAQWLELELTESLLLQDVDATLETLQRLKAIGIKLSVDDFGTGYSSLAYLKRFDVDKLKIDQSFVRDLVSDPDDAAIVRAIIEMAHSLKLKTIAEGVETQELADRLKLFHCDEGQGFWFAQPLPADALQDFIRAHAVPPRSIPA
ncbi:EAL domain-containing protein [Rhodocyclus gracilis]|uniref:EAL domain-containing protein n=1 Tax=Rhodocyclus tenuis TaxID=1066 RepID=A0A6L5K014_RHOTE|nr:EAL domain-containing protein [Rhodocyclus gracilis]MQY51828.1 EAL domain-containing protein [Rhodocyclus gracilis]